MGSLDHIFQLYEIKRYKGWAEQTDKSAREMQNEVEKISALCFEHRTTTDSTQ